MVNKMFLKSRFFFRGGRTALFPLALGSMVLLSVVMLITVLTMTCFTSFAQPSLPVSPQAGSTETPKSNDSRKEGTTKQTVEPRPDVQTRQGIKSREPVNRP